MTLSQQPCPARALIDDDGLMSAGLYACGKEVCHQGDHEYSDEDFTLTWPDTENEESRR